MDAPERYAFDFDPGEIVGGPGAVRAAGETLDRHGIERAVVVCGSTVGSTPAVMEPVREGLGERLVGVFDETSAAKHLATAVDAAAFAAERDADAVVAVGGGSSLDVARTAVALGSHSEPPRAVAERAVDDGSVPVGDDPAALVAVPTTLAGADLSVVAGITLTLAPGSDGPHPTGSVGHPALMPTALLYDAEVVASTPTGVRAASAMNGFDKAVEAIYSRYATPITDATATRGIELFREGVDAVAADDPDPRRLQRAIDGVVCAQYGVSTLRGYRLSLLHAFGHGVSHDHDVHQGRAHAAIAPHALRYLFDRVDGRRDRLAAAFGAAPDADHAEAVVDGVAAVRDALGLPARLRDLDGIDRADLPAIARATAEDGLLDGAPAGLDPDVEGLEGVLEAAW